jgi:hypothetical protein
LALWSINRLAALDTIFDPVAGLGARGTDPKTRDDDEINRCDESLIGEQTCVRRRRLLHEALGREEPRDVVDCWRGTSRIVDTVMAAAVAIVQGHVAADPIARTGTMKAV